MSLFTMHLPTADLICPGCGCRDEMACVHPTLGPCWWITDDPGNPASEVICSHCQLIARGEILETDVTRSWEGGEHGQP